MYTVEVPEVPVVCDITDPNRRCMQWIRARILRLKNYQDTYAEDIYVLEPSHADLECRWRESNEQEEAIRWVIASFDVDMCDGQKFRQLIRYDINNMFKWYGPANLTCAEVFTQAKSKVCPPYVDM
ncbi:hypothetical protein PAK_P100142c [Pseudomonas phage PAK_P1]|uniref:Uncharacterized protein n=4 Tax=Pakpunavirus TaxID=1921407 RepID=D4N3Z8_9CAUD|nr:hypothetical protein PAK_P100142c [Pseudomonas phage PAK_P1]YP_007236423.1 hypothetical protein PaP1_gp012 [Pseudomonas phage PaP1]YP_010762317.1 hypothetical protein QE324_gp017 [Pseudomonas phage ITTPL]KEH08759.1 hypothetical protein GY14_17940 [Delftia tsuruhatensis]KEH12963.1 hypothetical protein GY15_16440 [Delftia sp. 670]ADD64968.1 hypothetical protein PAK_P100142c [Pseudomonas phage PAK_P1]AEK21552.1 hypothetical protein PaP1_gp012 [Pseudomonas phage PaP1]QBP28032.1 hypothetical p